MKRDPALLVRGITRVASLPAIFVKLEEAINQPLTTNDAIAEALGLMEPQFPGITQNDLLHAKLEANTQLLVVNACWTRIWQNNRNRFL
jgi:hypothetical protein